jgi:hypothetical protein
MKAVDVRSIFNAGVGVAVDSRLVSAIGCILVLAATGANAADVETTLRVDEVKVYPRTAAVTRRGDVTIPAGERFRRPRRS